MEKLSIPNIVLTQGETSDTFEIYSKDKVTNCSEKILKKSPYSK